MKKINVHILKENWTELLDVLKILNWSNSHMQYRLNKYLIKDDITFLEYILINIIDWSIFKDYNINFIQYSKRVYFEINMEEFIFLSNKYIKLYDIRISNEIVDYKSILTIYIKSFKCFTKENDIFIFLRLLLYIYLWKNIIKYNLNETQIIYDFNLRNKILNNNSQIYYLKNYWRLLDKATVIINENNLTELILYWNLSLNLRAQDSIKLICDSAKIIFSKYDAGDTFRTTFNKKLFIITQADYNNKMKKYFSYTWNYILIV